jgi:hypothetical protein
MPVVADGDGLGLGVGEATGADVVGCGDGDLDGATRADLVRSGFPEPCGSAAVVRLGEAAGSVVTDAWAAMRSGALLLAPT